MPAIISNDQLKKIASQIRINIIKMIAQAGSGHPAGSLSITDILTLLYFHLLKHQPQKPNWSDRDYLLLSHGHVCPAWYATLAEAGYFSKDKLNSLRQFGSPLQGHPKLNSLPGVENSSGPLGQGISQACGLALALKMDDKTNKVYCLMSDGEQQEGQVWEAYMLANKYQLSNLIVLIDRNNIQIEGNTEKVMPLDNLKQKIRSFGWQVLESNGHDFNQLKQNIKKAWKSKNQPTAIICHTVAGKGVDFMEKEGFIWHGKSLNQEQVKLAIKQLTKI